MGSVGMTGLDGLFRDDRFGLALSGWQDLLVGAVSLIF